MQRFFYTNLEVLDNLILTNKDILHQCKKVLRLGIGDEVIFFDGEKSVDFVYEIKEIEKKSINFSFQREIKNDSELIFELVLYQAIPNKISKIEYIIQKCSEIGFSKIIFFSSLRSQKIYISENKKKRFLHIMTEAVEQSGRNKICKIEFLENSCVIPAKAGINKKDKVRLPHNRFLLSQEGQDENNEGQENINIIFHQEKNKDSKNIKDISIKKDQTVNIYVGPEGGFSDEEICSFEKNNLQKVYLGERILRCETAGVVTGFFLSQNF